MKTPPLSGNLLHSWLSNYSAELCLFTISSLRAKSTVTIHMMMSLGLIG